MKKLNQDFTTKNITRRKSVLISPFNKWQKIIILCQLQLRDKGKKIIILKQENAKFHGFRRSELRRIHLSVRLLETRISASRSV